MSTTTIVNSLPKALREELKGGQLYDACFTDKSRKTVKGSHAMLVPQGVEKMLEARQGLLLHTYDTEAPSSAHVVDLLRDIEVLRYTLTLLAREP